MCNWRDEARNQSNSLRNAPIERSFPVEFIKHRPPSTVIPGHCLKCGKPLEHWEMYPTGHPPRYMCKICYQESAYGDTDHCLWCGKLLPQNQISQRKRNPRELKYAFCQGPCLDYHKVLAGLVLGVPFVIEAEIYPALPYPDNPSQGGSHTSGRPHGRYLPGPEQRSKPKQIPGPKPIYLPYPINHR